MTAPRHEAREAALQALYLWEVGRVTPDEALATFFHEHQRDADDSVRAFAATLLHGVAAQVSDLDRVIEQHITNWRIERLSAIDRLVLRLAVWELRAQPETPPAVVLNEAIELARTFGSDESVRFVNGVLDAIRKTLEESGTGH
jgi:N utilization substance protein B